MKQTTESIPSDAHAYLDEATSTAINKPEN